MNESNGKDRPIDVKPRFVPDRLDSNRVTITEREMMCSRVQKLSTWISRGWRVPDALDQSF